jgi:hypothetical protein
VGRMRALATAFAVLAAAGCGCGGPASGNSSTGATSAGTTATTRSSGAFGSGSTGSANGTGGGSATAGSATTAGGSGNSSGTTSSGVSSGSLPGCGANAVWINGVCLLTSCVSQPIGATCLLPDGGVSFCAAGVCQGVDLTSDPNNCGGFGVRCVPGQSCDTVCSSFCEGSGSQACPTGTACYAQRDCVATSCTAGMTDQVCLVGTSVGFCCGTSCLLSVSAADCWACGRSCAAGDYCSSELGCVAAPLCDAGQENAPCALQSDAQYPGFCCHGVCEDPALDMTDCQACGQSCVQCDLGGSGGCPGGQGCTVDGLCAPTSCAGLADGLACSAQPSINTPGYTPPLVWSRADRD